MAIKVFISFRYNDGFKYKEELSKCFDKNTDIINFSEGEDRSSMSEETIKSYLYQKLKETSLTIIILTPEAVNYKKNIWGQYDDWLYDELRYSLEDRKDNRTNAIIGVYTEDTKNMLFSESVHKCPTCNEEIKVNAVKDFNNLIRKNMMNVKKAKKTNQCDDIFDSLEDSYCSLIEYNDFIRNMDKYVSNAIDKRHRINDFDIVSRM